MKEDTPLLNRPGKDGEGISALALMSLIATRKGIITLVLLAASFRRLVAMGTVKLKPGLAKSF